jgi:hypothetical protein
MITDSMAAGEAIPPHFQFSTSLKSKETQRVNVNSFAFFPNVKGMFGTSELNEWCVKIGMNEKGGMDDVEFPKYFFNSIVPLFPDSNDVIGKRMVVKVNSGPGRLQENVLAEARTHGFIVYPGISNTTAVTQETDQNYGPFKTQCVKNLCRMLELGRSTYKSSTLVGWINSLWWHGSYV